MLITEGLVKKGKVIAFISDGIVEYVLHSVPPLPEILAQGYTFVDNTQDYPDLPLGKFKIELTSTEGIVLPILSDEATYSVLKSNLLAVEVPEGLEVRMGWKYQDSVFSQD
jgi:hypothetical protein